MQKHEKQENFLPNPLLLIKPQPATSITTMMVPRSPNKVPHIQGMCVYIKEIECFIEGLKPSPNASHDRQREGDGKPSDQQ